MKRNFIIDHIDPLGQGVFKEEENIFFIPKTLPSEEGTFEITKKKKGVYFGVICELKKIASNRITPDCEHYAFCNGCQFLHTDYSSEIKYKQQSFTKLIKNSFNFETAPTVLVSKARLGYRNRIQLHYDLKKNQIGFLGKNGRNIISVPHCKIMNPLVACEFDRLVTRGEWGKAARKTTKQSGHLEIYDSPSGLHVSWNKPYAHGGFSQVHTEMNNQMLEYFSQYPVNTASILDLFAGKGNISNTFNFQKRICVDLYDEPIGDDFFHCDLFEDDAFTQFSKEYPDFSSDFILIDPPRSGFKSINTWVSELSPKNILYVSCHPATMMRDLRLVAQEYKIKECLLIDLFPSTYHYEAAIFLEKIT